MAEQQHAALRSGFTAAGIGTRVDGRVCDVCGWDDLWAIPLYRITIEGFTFLRRVERCARCRDRAAS